MKRLTTLSILLVLGCTPSPSEPEIRPELEPGHSLPHAAPCHVTTPATESQGQGGFLGQCVAIQ